MCASRLSAEVRFGLEAEHQMAVLKTPPPIRVENEDILGIGKGNWIRRAEPLSVMAQ